MAPSEGDWPTRSGAPLDVLAAHEEISMRLRRRCLDALDAEADKAVPGPDATRHVATYTKALDTLTRLQLDLGHLERAVPTRLGSQGSVPSGGCPVTYSPEEQKLMGYDHLTKDMTPPLESRSEPQSDPDADDA